MGEKRLDEKENSTKKYETVRGVFLMNSSVAKGCLVDCLSCVSAHVSRGGPAEEVQEITKLFEVGI